jgi:hypothetical protein
MGSSAEKNPEGGQPRAVSYATLTSALDRAFAAPREEALPLEAAFAEMRLPAPPSLRAAPPDRRPIPEAGGLG